MSTTTRKLRLLTIITPVHNEEGNIELFYGRCKAMMKKLDIKHELLFVNDGSSDNSLLVMLKLAETDKSVKVLNLSRNFGQQAAISAGIDFASGDAAVIIDADLQDPPELIAKLTDKWQEGFDIVSAKRNSRQDSFLKKLTADIFYKSLNLVITSKIPENVGEFRLIDRKALSILQKIREKDRYLRGLSNWIGFKQTFVLFDRDKRFAGKTNYNLSKMVGLALNAIFSFSRLPMRIATYSGIVLIILAFLIIIYVILSKLAGTTAAGWTSEVIILAIFNSIELLCLGVISEYVGRIYTQVQDRPMYIVADSFNLQKSKNAKSAKAT